MKKTLIASAIAVTALNSVNAKADIHVTNMLFGTTNYAAGGTLFYGGGGDIYSIDPFFYHTWTATQETSFLDNTDSWSGSSEQGAFDYDADIAAMTAGQIAVGLYFNWLGNNEIAVLEIFDCTVPLGTVENPYLVCTGNGVPMDNGPFAGSTAVFSSGPPVPVPAAAWLMGSGLLGLIGMARRQRRV